MKKYLFFFAAMALFAGCSGLLDCPPTATLDNRTLSTPEGVDYLCTAAYAGLRGPTGTWEDYCIPSTNWSFGDVRSEIAYKGGAGITDVLAIHYLEVSDGIFTTEGIYDSKWYYTYCLISRCDKAINALEAIDPNRYKQKSTRLAEINTLRVYYYFDLLRLFNKIVYFPSDTETSEHKELTNTAYSRDELLQLFISILEDARKDLPEKQSEIGRINKYTATALEAKLYLYKAYVQDPDTNLPVSIDQSCLNKVIDLTDTLISSNKFALLDDFQKLDLVKYDNSTESVFEVQYSINDGTPNGNVNWSFILNVPCTDPYNGCGFFQPSQNLVNSYKTDENGLPLFDTYNDSNLLTVADGLATNVDPRLDFVVGRPGIRWKTYTGSPYLESWAREVPTYGPYSCKRHLVSPESSDMLTGYPRGLSALNWDIIRYADVLLWRAEALIETDHEDEAVEYINMIRNRAKNSSYVKSWEDPTADAAKYVIDEYKPGVNCTWTKDYARKALYFERKLELAMEGERFFDLVRWGIAEHVLNDEFYPKEKLLHNYYETAHFDAAHDEYLPIPQNQIWAAMGHYKQNPGY